MFPTEYQLLAARTGAIQAIYAYADVHPSPEVIQRVLQGLIGFLGEFGEVADLIKKIVYHGHPCEPERLLKEVGDLWWYVADLHTAFGVPLNETLLQIPPLYPRARTNPKHGPPDQETVIWLLRHAQTVTRLYHDLFFEDYTQADHTQEGPPPESYLRLRLQEDGVWSYRVLRPAATAAQHLTELLHLDRGCVLQANVDKLKARYGERFSSQASLARTEDSDGSTSVV